MFWKKKAGPRVAAMGVLAATVPEVDEADDLNKRAEDLANALSAYEFAALEAEAKPEDDGLKSARKKVAAAEKVVLDGPIGDALVLRLIDHTESWHAWSDRSDFSSWVRFDAVEIEAEKKDISAGHKEVQETRTSFTFHGKRYTCVLRDNGYTTDPFEATKFGEAEFWDGTLLVLKLGLIQEVSEFSRWRSLDVRAFKPGPWMQDLLLISAQIDTRTEEEHRRYLDEDVLEAARNIDL